MQASQAQGAAINTSNAETDLRARIAQFNDPAVDTGEFLAEDTVLASGAFPLPLYGRAAIQEARAPVAASRRNHRQVNAPLQLWMAASGDLASETGRYPLTFDDAQGIHHMVDGQYLRTWQRRDRWQIVAAFYRPVPSAE